MHAATAHALDNLGIGHINLKHVVQGDPGNLHGLGLGKRARETVKQITGLAVALQQSVLNQTDDDVVGDQTASVHHLFGLDAEGRAGLDRCSQHVTGGNLRNSVLFANEFGLCPFTGAWCAEQNQSHYSPLPEKID